MPLLVQYTVKQVDRSDFLLNTATAAAASVAPGMSIESKAEAVEAMAMESLDRRALEQLEADVGVARPWLATPELSLPQPARTISGKPVAACEPPNSRMMMGSDPRLPPMPDRPTLLDFFQRRWHPASHLLQSANRALDDGHEEKVVLACLLHDVSICGLIRTDHGYWGAQLIEPYVDEEVAWAVRAHQALRFFPDPSVGYEYPELYVTLFGGNYTPSDYILRAYEEARDHRYYMTARLICLYDLYSFDPDADIEIDRFVDIIGRNFRQPKEGLGFDNSPVAHIWRTMIWPNNVM